MNDKERVVNAVQHEKKRLELEAPDPMAIDRWVDLMMLTLEDGYRASLLQEDGAALSTILRAAAMAQLCLEQHGVNVERKRPVTIDDVNLAMNESIPRENNKPVTFDDLVSAITGPSSPVEDHPPAPPSKGEHPSRLKADSPQGEIKKADTVAPVPANESIANATQ